MSTEFVSEESKGSIDTTSTEATATTTNDITTNDAAQSIPSTTTDTGLTDEENAIYTRFHQYPFDSDTTFQAGLAQILGRRSNDDTNSTDNSNSRNDKDDKDEEAGTTILKAKCFYFNRLLHRQRQQLESGGSGGDGGDNNPSRRGVVGVDPINYRKWLSSSSSSSLPLPVPNSSSQMTTQPSQSSPPPPSADSSQSMTVQQSSQPTTMSQPTTTSQQQPPPPPPYPTSFADIVELITNNKPVPGIEEVPDTVLAFGSSRQDRAVRRRKPWETTTQPDANSTLGQHVDGQDVLANTTTANASQNEDEMPGNPVTTAAQDQSQGLLRLLRPDAVPDSGLVAKD